MKNALLGFERLLSAEASPLDGDHLDEKSTVFEEQRALLHAYFAHVSEAQQERDANGFEVHYGKYRTEALDKVWVYRNLKVIEEQRRDEGKPRRLRFLPSPEMHR